MLCSYHSEKLLAFLHYPGTCLPSLSISSYGSTLHNRLCLALSCKPQKLLRQLPQPLECPLGTQSTRSEAAAT